MEGERSFLEKLEDFLGVFSGALINCHLYSFNHPQSKVLIKKSFQILEQLLSSKVKVAFAVMENELVVEDYLVPPGKTFITTIIRKFRRNGIESITFIRGIEYQEFADFIKDLSTPLEEGESKTLVSYVHIKLGRISISFPEASAIEEEVGESEYSRIHEVSFNMEKYIDVVKEIFSKVKKSRKVEITNFNEIIYNFILALKKQINPLLILAPIKTYDQYTYTHAINVGLLTCYQASNLGFPPEDIKEIGLSAMLHDIGKLFIPLEILNKKDILTEKEWKIIQNHPIEGAKLLMECNGITPLAIQVAYEHHMKYDLTGYPKPKYRHSINIISQLTSISDFYDALVTKRPYRKPLTHEEAIQLIYWKAGTDFNPKLVSNFIETLSK
jgi:HD-GYP domain-containing protein (c-di-GMP phosphodiesterase class II)